MGMVKKSISLTDQQAEWLRKQITSGDYGNESEVLRDLIRKEQSRTAEIEAIRAALIEGEASGISDLTPEQILAATKQHLKQNGSL
jgi:antitoxin ParD1/3/4